MVCVCVVVAVSVISGVEWMRNRRYGVGTAHMGFNFVAMTAGQLALVTATGGLFSPLIPAVIVTQLLLAVIGPRRALPLALLVLAFGSLAMVHREFSLIPELIEVPRALERGLVPWVCALVYSLALLLASRMGRLVGEVVESLFLEALNERDRRLSEHAEQNNALTSLSAAIAHELKNPLASVKGLAALIAGKLEGQTAERMSVLRREVERMQHSLDDHLNFSRPLVPLSMETTDLAELAYDVVKLFEGSATARSVRFAVDATPTSLVADPRKLRQVLVNLVQNAVDATPVGSRVVVRVTDADPCVLRVEDEGEGIDASLIERVFQAGVTTKAHGSGIGLVIGRSLARQHGGDLTLHNRVKGGCEARLTLPRSGPSETSA